MKLKLFFKKIQYFAPKEVFDTLCLRNKNVFLGIKF